MRQRCLDAGHKDYQFYGGRGIAISPSWCGPSGFHQFVKDMSPRIPGTTLDRIEVNGPYSPENCRWADRFTQMRNTRGVRALTFRGRTQTMVEWAEEFGLNYSTLRARLNKYGWPIERALTHGDPVNGEN